MERTIKTVTWNTYEKIKSGGWKKNYKFVLITKSIDVIIFFFWVICNNYQLKQKYLAY